MIQIVEQPFETAFTRNPVIYRFRAVDGDGNLYRPMGVRSEVRCSTFHGPEDGETMILNWTEPDGTTGSVTFTARTTPTAEDEIPAAVGASPGSYPDWTSFYNAIGEKMKQHPIVGPLFRFDTVNRGSGQSYWAEALELDSDWSVSWDVSGIATPPTFDVIDTTTITLSAEPDNYRIVWDLFLESTYQSENYDRVASGEEFINADSEAFLNLERILEAKAKTTLATPPIPAYDTNTALLADNLRRYYIRYREEYDGIASPSWTIASTRRVMIGGIAQTLFAAGDFLADRTQDTSLLTWKPNLRTIATDTKEYLAWYNYTGETKSVLIEYRGMVADGSESTAQFIYESPDVQALAGETILFPVGFEQLGQSDDAIVSYTVQVVDKSSPYDGGAAEYLSVERTYQLDRYYRESERTLMYLNGFGCPETLRCIGYHTTDLQVERDEANRTLEPGYSTSSRELFQFDEDWQNVFTYRSGYLSKAELDSLQELAIYNEAFEIFSNVYVPLFITSSQFPISETRSNLDSITLVAVPALRHRNYSNILLTEETAGEYWLTITGGNWLTTFGQPWQIV